jgi:hypothetical protein
VCATWPTTIGWADASMMQRRGPARWTRSTVDRSKGYVPNLIWTIRANQTALAVRERRVAAGGRRAAAPAVERRRLAGGGPNGAPVHHFDGERMERKRRSRGNSPEAWKGGREVGRGDRRGGSGGPSVRRCCVGALERKRGARDTRDGAALI